TVNVGGVINRTASTWNGSVAINDTGNVLETASNINRVAGQNVGVYNILGATFAAPAGSAAANYAIASLAGSPTLTITARPLTLPAQAGTKVYDGGVTSATAPAIGGGGLAFSDTISGLAQVYDTKNAGPRTLSVAAGFTINDGNGGNNYLVT